MFANILFNFFFGWLMATLSMRLQFCLLRTMGPRRGRLRATQQERERKRRAPLPAGLCCCCLQFRFRPKKCYFWFRTFAFQCCCCKIKENQPPTKLRTTHMHMACIAKFAEHACMRVYVSVCVCVLKTRRLQRCDRRRVLSTMQANGSKANGEGNSFWDLWFLRALKEEEYLKYKYVYDGTHTRTLTRVYVYVHVHVFIFVHICHMPQQCWKTYIAQMSCAPKTALQS